MRGQSSTRCVIIFHSCVLFEPLQLIVRQYIITPLIYRNISKKYLAPEKSTTLYQEDWSASAVSETKNWKLRVSSFHRSPWHLVQYKHRENFFLLFSLTQAGKVRPTAAARSIFKKAITHDTKCRVASFTTEPLLDSVFVAARTFGFAYFHIDLSMLSKT